jgi:hypothetical protein
MLACEPVIGGLADADVDVVHAVICYLIRGNKELAAAVFMLKRS